MSLIQFEERSWENNEDERCIKYVHTMNNEAHTHTVAHKDSNEYNMKMAKKLAFHFTRRSRKGIKRNARQLENAIANCASYRLPALAGTPWGLQGLVNTRTTSKTWRQRHLISLLLAKSEFMANKVLNSAQVSAGWLENGPLSHPPDPLASFLALPQDKRTLNANEDGGRWET